MIPNQIIVKKDFALNANNKIDRKKILSEYLKSQAARQKENVIHDNDILATIREVIERDRINFYNSISNSGQELIGILGPIIGLLLINVVGAQGSLIINAVTFLLSAISECFLVRLDNIPQEKTIFYLVSISAFVNFFLAGYNLIVCLIPFLLFGAMLTMFNINFMSYVQITVDENYLGRVFSVIFTVAVMFIPLGSFVFSLLKITTSIAGFSIMRIGIVLLAIISYILTRPASSTHRQ